jgi:hypothetical protein
MVKNVLDAAINISPFPRKLGIERAVNIIYDEVRSAVIAQIIR